jgi:hypothetical protein
MDNAGMLAGAGVPVGVGVLVGMRACWGEGESVGLASNEGVGVDCLLLWTADSGGIWQAESSQQMQIKAMMNV